jgi:hypothetical protein
MKKINIVASEIAVIWGKGISPYAMPYLEAMLYLENIDDLFGCEPAREIIQYFLMNARGFKGPDARRLKNELKVILRS